MPAGAAIIQILIVEDGRGMACGATSNASRRVPGWEIRRGWLRHVAEISENSTPQGNLRHGDGAINRRWDALGVTRMREIAAPIAPAFVAGSRDAQGSLLACF